MGYAQQAIDDFLARELKDCSPIKQAPIEQIDALLAKAKFEPPCPLWPHQKRAAVLGVKYPSFLFLLDMGMGKSRLGLSLFDFRLKRGDAQRMLLLTPFSSVINEWRRECSNFPGLRFLGLDGTTAENAATWERDDCDIMACTVAMFLRKVGAAKGSKVDYDVESERLIERFDFLVFDESSYLRKRDTTIFKTLNELSDAIPYRYFLTGTPMNGNPEELWPQFKLVDGGETLGHTISLYREAFFTKERRRFGKARHAFDYKFKQSMGAQLHQRLWNSSIRYEAKEHTSMPDMIGGLYSGNFLVKRAVLPEATERIYNSMLEEIRKAKGDKQVVENTYARMRQVCAGYMSLPDELDSVQVKFPNNPKLTLLDEVLDQLPKGAKVVVACWYQATAALVHEHLKKRKALKIDGGTNAENRKKYLDAFRNTSKCDILVGTVAIGYGVNLKEASHIIFFESPDSHIDREQFERRVLRGDSEHRPTCIELCIGESVDEWILDRLLSREKVNASVIRGIGGTVDPDEA